MNNGLSTSRPAPTRSAEVTRAAAVIVLPAVSGSSYEVRPGKVGGKVGE